MIEIIQSLESRGYSLIVEGDRLIVRPASNLDDELRRLIRENKAAIIEAIRQRDLTAGPTEDPGAEMGEPATVAVKLFITNGERRKLFDLGYSFEDMNAMKSDEATQIIEAGTRRAADQLEPDSQPADTAASANGSAHVEPPAAHVEPPADQLREHKAALLELLITPGRCPICHELMNLQDKARDAWFCPGCRTWHHGDGSAYVPPLSVPKFALEERAAVAEFDGGMSRPDAEQTAMAEWQGRAPEPDPPDALAERQAQADNPWAVVLAAQLRIKEGIQNV